ncbi:MBL fold metallo-hydrolase [Bdellovibrionota bacterium FG-1]
MMQPIAPHLYSARTRISNVWLLKDNAGNRFLVDTGHAIERLFLLGQLWTHGVRAHGDLTAILLTHRHSDHAGNAAFLRKQFGARVICHENDASALTGRVTPPPLARTEHVAREQGKQRFYERWLCAYEDRAPAFTQIDDTYQEGPWRWGFHVIPVPGHTEGSVMLYHEPSQTLLSGDAILVGSPFSRHSRELRLAEPAFSQDANSCHLAVQRYLRNLPPTEILCSGHGPALDENTHHALLKLKKIKTESEAAPLLGAKATRLYSALFRKAKTTKWPAI